MSSKAKIPDFASVSDLQRNYAMLLKALATKGNPLYVLKKNKLQAVIVTPDFFKLLIEKAEKFEEQKALGAIGVYKRERKQKKLKKLKEVDELFE